jgi:glycosidase
MTDAIRRELEQVYPPDIAAQLYSQIQTRLPADAPPSTHERFSERDVVLITYADSLRHEGQSPLQTLRQFAQDHLNDTVSTIHLLPFYPYSSDDGFSVQDFYAVNPTNGDWDDIAALSDQFPLMFDAVFNHMSAQSDWFRRFLAREDGYADMFVTGSPDEDLSMVTRPRTSDLLTEFERPDGETVHVWTTFSDDQVDINFADPTTLLRMLDVLLFYVEQGAKVVRLDAIAFLWKERGTSCDHLPQTHAIIRLMRAVLDAVAPETVLITETNVPHEDNITYFGDGYTEAQMVYNFTLPPMLFHTMLSGDCTQLNTWVKTLSTPSDQTTFFNFTASHDGIGMRPVEGILSDDEVAAMISHAESTGGRVSYKTLPNGGQKPYELNVTYVDAVTDPSEPTEMQVKRFLVTQAIAMALAGVPAVYIHSLVGSRNDLAGMEAGGRNRLINRAKLNTDTLRAELTDNTTFRAQVFNGYQHLLRTRRKIAAFHPNSEQTVINTGNPAVFGLLRTGNRDQRVLALCNVTARVQSVTLDGITGTPTNLLTEETITLPNVSLEPYAVMWLELT